MICPRCKHEVRDNDYYCRECGLKIERCPICHSPLMPNAIYCSHCGYQVVQQESSVRNDYADAHETEVPIESDKLHVKKVLLIVLIVYLVMMLSLRYLYFGPNIQASQPPTPTQEVTPPNAHQI